MEHVVTVNGINFDVDFDATPYHPAKIYGPPEDCYPAEGGEVSINSVCFNGEDFTELLTEDVMERILVVLDEYVTYDMQRDLAESHYESMQEEEYA